MGPRFIFVDFMAPIVSSLKGTRCEAELVAIGCGEGSLMDLGDSCQAGLEDACSGCICLVAIMAIKVPEISSMLSAGLLPNGGKFPWDANRCLTEWISTLFLLSYCSHAEYPLVLFWEQVVVIVHCIVAVRIIAAGIVTRLIELV
jgi:hypothetical protein